MFRCGNEKKIECKRMNTSHMESDPRTLFIAQTAREREQRLHMKEGTNALIWVQAIAKGISQRRDFGQSVRKQFDDLLSGFTDLDRERELPLCRDVLKIACLFVRIAAFPNDVQRACQLCRCLIQSMSSASMQHSYVALLLSKNHIQCANRLIVAILSLIPSFAAKLQLEKVADGKVVTLFVHCMVTLSSCNSWALVRDKAPICTVLNQMCNKTFSTALGDPTRYANLACVLERMVGSGRLCLPSSVCNGLFNVLFRVMKNNNFSEVETSLFVEHCLVCPALLVHLSASSVDLLVKNGVFAKAISALSTNPDILCVVSANHTLFLLANLIHLSYLDQIGLVECLIEWTNVMNRVLIKCDEFVVKKQGGSRCHWHPVFGWFCEPLKHSIEGSLPLVTKQLQYLWSKPVVSCLFDRVLQKGESSTTAAHFSYSQTDLSSSIQKLWKKLHNLRVESQPSTLPQPLPCLSMTAVVCQLYENALLTLTTLHSDILAGLCREDFLLPLLWAHIVSLSPDDHGLSYLLGLLSSQPPTISHFAPLILFANCATSVISILDEEEMYEKGGPFTVEQLCGIARFCNRFCFRSIWNSYLNASQTSSCPLFTSVYQLCILLYNRDCRRSFTTDSKFWLAPDVKSSTIMNEFEKKTERATFLMSKMSHLVVLHERILLFRKYIAAEKETLEGAPNTMITVERTRIVEDGYRQLSMLSSNSLKATIRVKFVNQQGLDEAGIDQDGVFKEFLELTLKRVFHPDLNLFKTSPNRHLFPSPTSNLHDDHLALFQFVGRMLAKAVYEGIVVEVHLAAVILATVLGRRLCAFDELSQLDPELYKSLTYVKHYSDTGDVSDLSLTFSTDEDVLGRLHTVDLTPGGRAIQVTNENKIAYVHKMAQYRVFNQTKQQCRAFVTGFLSILNANWLSLFAPHELQYLISGQSSDIDLRDLRKHVQYYGGFHSNHRLIKWLWQILECDFSVQERHLFLKFVTSCSRAPLLGFAYLEPPFSIRCVEVSDDQDQGDTLASVVRGFLAIKRRQSPARLPTSSTCFNLLKLPNYSKKSVLLQKLRYAIHSETGFELS